MGNQECALSIFPRPYSHLITPFFKWYLTKFPAQNSSQSWLTLTDPQRETGTRRLIGNVDPSMNSVGEFAMTKKCKIAHSTSWLQMHINSRREILTWHILQFLPVILVLQLHWPVSRLHCWSTEPTSLHAHARKVITVIIISYDSGPSVSTLLSMLFFRGNLKLLHDSLYNSLLSMRCK